MEFLAIAGERLFDNSKMSQKRGYQGRNKARGIDRRWNKLMSKTIKRTVANVLCPAFDQRRANMLEVIITGKKNAEVISNKKVDK